MQDSTTSTVMSQYTIRQVLRRAWIRPISPIFTLRWNFTRVRFKVSWPLPPASIA